MTECTNCGGRIASVDKTNNGAHADGLLCAIYFRMQRDEHIAAWRNCNNERNHARFMAAGWRRLAERARANSDGAATKALDSLFTEAFDVDPMPTCAAVGVYNLTENLRSFIRMTCAQDTRAASERERALREAVAIAESHIGDREFITGGEDYDAGYHNGELEGVEYVRDRIEALLGKEGANVSR